MRLNMSALDKIAYSLNIRSDVPNQKLAKELAESEDYNGIKEIAENLWNKNKRIQSNCIKVLYETGYLKPELISVYVDDFLRLLKSKNNRLVWGGMIALSTIAHLKAKEIWVHIDDVINATEQGSLITNVSGVKALSGVASVKKEYSAKLFPILSDILKTCIPRDVPMHGENMLCFIDIENEAEFVSILESRIDEMKPAQLKRLNKLFKSLDKIK